MTRTGALEVLSKVFLVAYSAGFPLWFVCTKLVCLPSGTWR